MLQGSACLPDNFSYFLKPAANELRLAFYLTAVIVMHVESATCNCCNRDACRECYMQNNDSRNQLLFRVRTLETVCETDRECAKSEQILAQPNIHTFVVVSSS